MATSLNVPLATDAGRRLPAPGELELVRQFVNTYDVETAWDELTDPTALSAWLAERGLLPAGQRLTDRDLAAAQAFRDALRAVLAANAGHGDGPAARHSLDHLASHYPLRVRINGTARLEPGRGRGVAPAMGRLLATMYDAMATGTWVRLKACTNDECQWAFYDHSRNRSGAWCTMAVCGNRMKGRAFRRRHAEGDPG
ncbi:MAG TPA: CGNR zinc finger domain-containing protein [Candidatus Limnocylindria bacterium]|nr:CGNR zinc finger domain-containing protein [Candidatus Limnocylindria bacterium]